MAELVMVHGIGPYEESAEQLRDNWIRALAATLRDNGHAESAGRLEDGSTSTAMAYYRHHARYVPQDDWDLPLPDSMAATGEDVAADIMDNIQQHASDPAARAEATRALDELRAEVGPEQGPAEQNVYGRMYTGQQRGAFLDFLRSRLAPKPGADAADMLLDGKVRPSRQLMNVAAAEIRDREQFVLLDQQRIAYETVMTAVREARRSNRKQVVVVTGGPGSGKSVIAMSLLGELYRRGVTALHATGSQSFTKTMRKVAGVRKPEVQKLFKYFNSFMDAEPNDLDVLICDEAHRLRKTSANRYTKAALRTGRPQVAELIDAARVPVFLLDQHQVVRPGEMGTREEIERAAAEQGLDCKVVELDGQFRCGGSEAYERWVVDLLGLEGGSPHAWEPDGKFELKIAESPRELEDFLVARRAQGYGARMSAGYCWKWTTKITPGMTTLPTDVVIGDWARPWNVYGDRSLLGAPPAPLWATDPAGFGQVGCVYTAQGFEYDWSGVIIGPDLVWRTDRWVVDRSASKDPSFTKATPDEDVDRLVRNTYKVLLTRGMVGTIVHSTDPETREKLRSLVSLSTGVEMSAELEGNRRGAHA